MSANEDYAVVDGSLDAQEGMSATVWVVLRASLRVQVIGPSGEAIEGASVRWFSKDSWNPVLSDIPFWALTPDHETVSDATGMATIDEIAFSVGRLCVIKNGYLPEQVQLCRAGLQVLTVHLERSNASSREIRFTAMDDGSPLEGLTLVTPFGNLPTVSDAHGKLELPAWIDNRTQVAIRGPVICPCQVRLDPEVAEIEVARSSQLRIRVALPSGEKVMNCLVVVEELDPPTGFSQGLVPTEGLYSSVTIHDRATAETCVRRNALVRLSAVSSDGSSASVNVRPLGAEMDVSLQLEAGPQLELRVKTESDEAIEGVVVLARYTRSDEMLFRGQGGGVLDIPSPEALQDLVISADGFLSAYLSPLRDTEGSRGGTIDVVLTRAYRVSVRFEDELGQPLSGWAVSVDDSRNREAYRRFPKLWGSWPTSHPAWIEDPPPPIPGALSRTTDGEGRIVLEGLLEGEICLALKPHPMRSPGYRSPMFIRPKVHLTVPSNGEVLYTLPALRLLTIEASEATTGYPLHEFLIADTDGDPGPPDKSDGSFWQGWVQVGHRIKVFADGFDSSTFEMKPGPEPAVEKVVLWPTEPRHIVLSGDVSGLIDRELRFGVYTPPYGNLPDPALLYRGKLQASETCRYPVYLPFKSTDLLLLDNIYEKDGYWDFSPAGRSLGESGDLEFTVQKISKN